MLMVREREKLSFETLDLIDKSIKAYQNRTALPRITFWGIVRVLGACGVFSLERCREFEIHVNSARLNFLNGVFGGTNVDPQALVFNGRRKKTRDNYLTEIWHLKWKYKKLTGWAYDMIEAFQKAPYQTLNGVRRKLERMLLEEDFDRELYKKKVCELFNSLYPNRFDLVQQDAGRLLAIIFVVCLLGEDVVFDSDLNDTVCSWLNGANTPSAPIVWKPLESTGIYRVEDGQIDVDILPDIVCGEKSYSYDEELGSPLHQIIHEHRNDRWFFLCGHAEVDGGSAVSGAGKTTSLRFLAQEENYQRVLWLPLTEIYDRHSMKDQQNLSHYIARQFHITLEELSGSALLLFDGLDELFQQEQLDRLSGDLSQLQSWGSFGLVVSSKLPWERLPGIDVLCGWSSVWDAFLRCSIQVLTEDQRKKAMPDGWNGELLRELNTPFLVSLYRRTAALPDDPRISQKLKRWGAETMFWEKISTKQALFYRSLIVQLLRWFEAERGREEQWEMDAFLLLHTLPAIACQMLRNETAAPELDPASGVKIDRAYLMRMADVTWRVGQAGLDLFPGYGRDAGFYRRRLRGLNGEKFLSGAAPSLFLGEWNSDIPYDEPHFVNNALRNYLAYLHIANVFLLALEDRLETSVEALEAYGHTLELMPSEQVQQVAEFFQLIAPDRKLETILVAGPSQWSKSPLSRFLAGHIGATMCEFIPRMREKHPGKSKAWYGCMTDAWSELELNDCGELKEMAVRKLGLAYIYGQVQYARSFRGGGDYVSSDQCAQRVIKFQTVYPQVINSDGHHMKALNLWGQIQAILNGTPNVTPIPVSQADSGFAFDLYSELEILAARPEMESRMFPSLSFEQRDLIPLFVMILQKSRTRWNAYEKKDYWGNQYIQFLCEASYVAKAHSIYAACCAGASGMSFNLLGSLVSNNCEAYENDPRLPFFKQNPGLHLPLDDLNYQNRFASSFQMYQCIYHVQRGPQPYSARRLSELLLRRKVRLERSGRITEIVDAEPFTDWELEFLEQATTRSVTNSGNSETYWRARYLHDRARQCGGSLDSARQMLRTAWEKCNCGEKLAHPMAQKVDIISVLIILEDLALNGPDDKWERDKRYQKIFDFLRRYRDQIQKDFLFVTGMRPDNNEIQDCLKRMLQLQRNEDHFVTQDMMMRYKMKLID